MHVRPSLVVVLLTADEFARLACSFRVVIIGAGKLLRRGRWVVFYLILLVDYLHLFIATIFVIQSSVWPFLFVPCPRPFVCASSGDYTGIALCLTFPLLCVSAFDGAMTLSEGVVADVRLRRKACGYAAGHDIA